MISFRESRRPDRFLHRRSARFCVLLLVVASALFSATFAHAAGLALRARVPAAVNAMTPVGPLDATKHLGLAISLPLRNPEDLTNLLREIYDPASTNFHHYLSTEQFTERFGPVLADYQRVADFMASNGFTVTQTYANRLVLDVDASVADIQRTFHINLRVFNHPTESRTFFAPDTGPTLDADLPILQIDGLDNFVLPRPASLHKIPAGQAGRASPFHGSAPDGSSYIGSDFRKAYLPNVTLDGAGQTVGLFELDGFFPSDIATYKSQAGLPNIPVSTVLINYNGAAGGANGEVALDIDMAMCMAPGLNSVIVYEGTLPNSILARMASDNQAKQLSCSWGWSGFPDNPPIENIFMEYAAQGQSFFASSGDSGAYVGTNGIMTPSDDANITIVGGTTLFTDSSVHYTSEQVWNWLPGQSAASSGGTSTTVPIPSWQLGVNMTANLGSTNLRNIPDVALTADNIYIIADDGIPQEVGGTSAAAPLWAGMTALMNQQAVASGESNVGFLNPALYAIGKGGNYHLNFHDITTGNNTNLSSSPFYPATTGFDLCTGWGTPAGSNLINTLAPPIFAPRMVAGTTALAAENCLPTNGAIDPGETVTVIFNLQNIGTAATTNLVVTMLTNAGVTPSGGSQTYGVIPLGGGTAGRAFTFTANGSCGASVTAALRLQDGPTNLGTISFPFILGAGAGGITTFSQNFDSVPVPLLPMAWSSTHSSGEPAWVTTKTSSDTPPNSAFAKDNATAGQTQLISPAISVNLPTAQLEFRHSYNTDTGFDGGILLIQINGGAYQDIVAAGGSFVTNGYTGTLGNSSGNPIGGMQAWTGNSGGFITTIVNLPASAAGQVVRFNWQFGTDNSFSGVGWYVDTVAVLDGFYTCCTGSADVAVTQTASPNPALAGQNLTYTLAITNIGSSSASGVTVTDTLPAGVTFVSASPGATLQGGTVVAAPGTVINGSGTNILITVKPAAAGTITNVATVATTAADSNPANNSSSLVTTVDALPVITAGPTNFNVLPGGTATFSVAAVGTPAPAFRWFLNVTNPVGTNSSLLTLTNVQPSQAGLYSVLVTNVAGSTNSVSARLALLQSPGISGITAVRPNVSVSFPSVLGLNYTLEYKNLLTDPSWIILSPSTPGTGGLLTLHDTNAVPALRFYRILTF